MQDAKSHVYGLDIGSISLVAARDDGELLRNELGSNNTACMVSFSGSERLLGEAAGNSLSNNARNTATTVGRLATLPHATVSASALAPHWQFTHGAKDGGALEMEAQYAGEARKFSSVQLLGALLSKARATSAADESSPLAIALQPCFDTGDDDEAKAAAVAFARAALLDSAVVGGWKLVALPTVMEAMAAVLCRKYPAAEPVAEAADEPPMLGQTRFVLIVDVGATAANAAIVCVDAAPGEQVVAEAGSHSLGCADIDAAVWGHLAKHVAATHRIDVTAGSRAGQRLLDACERIRKLLSTLPSASATAENLGDGVDVKLDLSRDELATLGAATTEKLATLLSTLLAAAPSPLVGVELVGGGTRMPIVQAVVAEALAASDAGSALTAGGAELRFGAKLDDASVALGAALLGRAAVDATAAAAPATADAAADAAAAAAFADEAVPGRLEASALAAAVAEEAAMAAADKGAAALSALRNSFEGLVLEARGRRGRKHGELIDGAKLEPLLDTAEDWLYSDEGEAADAALLESKLAQLQEGVAEACAAYTAKAESARMQEEQQLEQASAQAAAERAANGEEDEDHDTRKLKFPERLRMVLKNKDEGTELFKGQNYRPAAARYNKALTHAAKFVDMSPEQRKEVEAAKLSLQLNLAQCWLKITDADNHLAQAIRCCDEALKLDEANVKALYRKAVALEAKGDYDEAKAVCKSAAALAPDDAAMPKLMTRIAAQLKRQKDKEKKMAAKMFG